MPRAYQPPADKRFRRMVKARLAMLGMTQDAAARKAGVSSERFRQWRDLYPRLAPETIRRMAKVLRVNQSDLASWCDTPPPDRDSARARKSASN